MFVSESLSVNQKGNLDIGGCDAVELAREFGTPLYVMDEVLIRKNCRDLKAEMDAAYDGRGLPLYASKAFCCKEMCRIVADEGLGLDVASGGDLYTAIEAGFPAEKIVFHGNNKTKEELALALRYNAGRVMLDNIFELEQLNAMASAENKTIKAVLRIKPGVEPHTHKAINTGKIDSKFGLAIETGEAMDAVERLENYRNIELMGIHCHIGSQIFETDAFERAARIMIEFAVSLREQTGIVISEVNLGGGFAVRYVPSDSRMDYAEHISRAADAVKAAARRLDFPMPFVYIEPGRSIAAQAGTTLYEIGAIKEIPDVRNFVIVDGGMNDNPRYALYRSPYEAVIANKASLAKDYTATIAGRSCESGDLLQENAPIQTPQSGDILAVTVTGAYNYSMSTNYNRFPRPAVVFVRDGAARIAVRRETYEYLVRNDV